MALFKALFLHIMTTNNNDMTPLVGVTAADNTFLVPNVEYTKVVSEDKFLVNHKQPNDLFDRDILLGTGLINNTNSLDTNLLGFFDPFRLYLNSPVVVNALKPYKFVKFGMIITIKMVTPGACYGLYNIQALCDGGINSTMLQDSSAFDSYPTSTQDVHGFLDLEARNNVVLELPWEHYLNGHDLTNTDPIMCWRLLLWPLSPIRSSLATTANGSFQIYGRMSSDREFVNLRFQSKKEKKTSSYLKDFSHYANMAGSMVPSIAPFAAPAAAGLAALSTLADAMGYTRESAPQIPDTFVRRQTTSLAATDGQDRSEIVALTIGNTLSIDPAPGGGDRVDPMANSELFKRWTIIDVFDINNLSTDIIRNIAVTPYICNERPGFYAGNPPQSFPTTGGWVGLPFSAWRGGMEYLIYIPSVSTLQGSLQILWDPADVPLATYPTDPTHVLSNVMIDLKGSSKTCLQVGYSKLEPVAKSVFVSSGEITSFANGHLRFRVAASLQNPMLTTVTVTVIVMARPMQDMKFGFPSNDYAIQAGDTGFITRQMENLRYQSGDSDGDDSSHTIVLAPSDPYYTTEVHFGEDIMSVRALIQHFNAVKGFNITDTQTSFLFSHFYPTPSSFRAARGYPEAVSTNGLIQPAFTYYAYYLIAFVGLRGSTRYKILMNNGSVKVGTAAVTNSITSTFPNIAYNTPLGFGYAGGAIAEMQNATETDGAEFTIPSRNPLKYYSLRKLFDVDTGTEFRRDAIALEGTGAGCVYMAAGPDTTVTRFRRIPGLLLSQDI